MRSECKSVLIMEEDPWHGAPEGDEVKSHSAHCVSGYTEVCKKDVKTTWLQLAKS